MAIAKRAEPFRLTAPIPRERDVHKACAKALDRCLLPPAKWCSYPAGASILSPQQAARHIGIGLKRGYPDIWIFYNGIYGIELKRPGEYLSRSRWVRTRNGHHRFLEGQEQVFPQLIETGAWKAISICHTVDDVFDRLERWNIPHRGRIAA